MTVITGINAAIPKDYNNKPAAVLTMKNEDNTFSSVNATNNLPVKDSTSLGQSGFDIITVAMGEQTGVWVGIEAVNGDAIFKAKSSTGSDFADNGSYSTGNGIQVIQDNIKVGPFTKITVTNGLVRAIRG